MPRLLRTAALLHFAAALCIIALSAPAFSQTPAPFPPPAAARPPRPVPPTRDPHTPGYVDRQRIARRRQPSRQRRRQLHLGPTHNPAPEVSVQPGVPQGTVYEFTMSSADSKIYPGIARDPGHLRHARSRRSRQTHRHHQPPRALHAPRRRLRPSQYVPGTAAPFIVGADGPDHLLFTALDNLIAEHRVPVMIAISIGNGSGDAQGSERGLEYDTMSGRYAEFVETEVLPLVETQATSNSPTIPMAAPPWAAVPAAPAP